MADDPSGSACRAFDRRLERGSGRPIAVALSGGGDSLALLRMARDWAERAGRKLLALTLDHRLQAQGGEWAAWCARRCAGLGVEHRTLVWEEPKPASGLAAAARQARHALIAEAARDAGARIVLFGHTADDVAEARAMRAAGLRITAPACWSPSPVWPEGRGVFLLRPLLDARRADLRAWLRARAETWIDDPANEDLAQPRARARAVLGPAALATPPMAPEARRRDLSPPGLACGPAGEIHAPALGFGAPGAERLLAAAITCVSGRAKPPRGEAVARLAARLAAGEAFAATLGGCRIQSEGDEVLLARESADRRSAAAPRLELTPGQTQVFDGRFEARAEAPGTSLELLRGRAGRLEKPERTALSGVPTAARPGLPALVGADGRVTCPTLAPDPRLAIRSLVSLRLAGACGAIETEAELVRRWPDLLPPERRRELDLVL